MLRPAIFPILCPPHPFFDDSSLQRTRADAARFMKPRLVGLLSGLTLGASVCGAAEVSDFERAFLELPPQFVADIPLAQRPLVRGRLDLEHSYLHWYSDGRDIDATSMLYLRQFRRADGGFVVLTHMPKPYADGSNPEANQTFVFERRKDQWEDITAEVMPKGIDLTAHFRPRKASDVVEVAPYVRIKRQDGRGDAYQFGAPAAELHWDGRTFLKREATKKTLSND
jgi:hypothetical protein